MPGIKKLYRHAVLALLVTSVGACGVSWNAGPGYPYGYYDNPFYSTDYGYYTFVRRPAVVVDGWTGRAFRYRPYRGYIVRRHNSPVIAYNATRGDALIQVDLTPLADSTRIEVRARKGGNSWSHDQAKALLRDILDQNKKSRGSP